MTTRRSITTTVFALALAAIAASAPAAAQREPSGGFPREPSTFGKSAQRNQAGQFDYYLMALSWSPSYCASLPRDGYDPQCHRRDGKRYSFVLHGLWPQYNRGWPQDCPSADRGFVPRPVATRMLDIMPSERLVFHEYRKHGTCSGLGVDGYFGLARNLYEKVVVPQAYRQVSDPRLFVSTADLIKDFLAANPTMKPDSLVVDCGGAGPRLKEIRVCFGKTGEFISCGRNEDQRKLCSATRIYVPPVREAALGVQPQPGPAGAQPSLQSPLPGTGDRKI